MISFHPVRDSYLYSPTKKQKDAQSLTRFQEKVYEIVKKIPRGKTLTYKKLARLAGSPRAFRAVGNILNKNRDKKIPCHRVIRSDGTIGGYNKGVWKKIGLLKKEGVVLRNKRVAN